MFALKPKSDLPTQLHASYIYVAENQVLSVQLAETTSASFFSAVIASNSSILVLDMIAKKLHFLSPFESSHQDVRSVDVDQTMGIPSLVLCGSALDFSIQDSEMPLLMQLSDTKLHQNLDESVAWTSDLDESIRSDNLPLNDALGMFNEDASLSRQVSNTFGALAAHLDDGVDRNGNVSGRSFVLAHLSIGAADSSVTTYSGLNKFLKLLPNDQITHIDFSISGSTIVFVTASSVFTFSLNGSPIAKASLPSSIKLFEPLAGDEKSTEGYTALCLENNLLRIHSLPRLELVYEGSFPGSTSMRTVFLSASAHESLIIFHKDATTSSTSFAETHQLSSLGYYSIINPSKISTSSSEDSPLASAVESGMNARKNGSGAESLVIALQGRLQASKSSLDDIQLRLDDKRNVANRAISILSRLSIDTAHSLTAIPRLKIPFAIEHDLKPIIGSSTRPAPESIDLDAALDTNDRIEASSGRIVYSDKSYLLQFAATNRSSAKVARARNVVANADGARCRISLLHAPHMPPHSTAIISASITIEGAAMLDPYIDISFLLEIGWRDANPPTLGSAPMQSFLEKHSPSEPEWKTELVSLGRTRLDAYPANAFTGLAMRPVLTLPLSPYSTSLLATSDVISAEGVVQDFFASRLRQMDNFGDFFHNTNTGLIAKTYSHGGSVCIEIGSMESEDEILRLIQALYRYFDGLEIATGSDKTPTSSKEAIESLLKITENALNPQWVSRCKRIIMALKHEIQLSICMKQLMSESADPDQAYSSWKRQFAEAQSSTDLAIASPI